MSLPVWSTEYWMNELLPTITRIVSLSILDSSVPTALKEALVAPLLKKANLPPHFLKNYCPVSGLPFISKIVEKVVVPRLRDNMAYNNLNEPFQSAYRKFHSVESALLCVQNDVLLSLDKGQFVFLVLLDFSAAFDTIDHGKLLSTLHDRIGVADNALWWFASYLRDRSQRAVINGSRSDPSGLICGVPQGSVLGPLLFTMYTLALGRCHYGSGRGISYVCRWQQLYLDFDGSSAASGIRNMESCIADIQCWMTRNFLKLNNDKTEFMVLENPILRTVPYMLVIFVFLRLIL